MLRLIRSLGRLSIRGYLALAAFAVIALLATYANLRDIQQMAAQQAGHQSSSQAAAANASLSEAAPATSASSPQTLSDNTASEPQAPAAQSSPVAKARHQADSLVFTPVNITLSLSHKLPTVTVTTSDGGRISTPEVISTTGDLGLTPVKSASDTSPSWQMQLSGQPTPGTYQVTLHASSDTTDYTGTMTVVVIL